MGGSFLRIAERPPIDLVVLNFAGCPPIGGVPRTGVGSKDVLDWRLPDSERLLNAIIGMKPDAIVLAARWSWIKELKQRTIRPKNPCLDE